MAYRDEVEGSHLLGYCLVATLRVWKENTGMIDKRLNLLVHGARSTLLIVLGT